MHEQRTARIRRFSLWFCLNFAIFVACYLNYRLQLKHRYLYKTLNVGLCFSRAAAMVINFNLLLVWLPMCKYTLTRLACLANGWLRREKEHLHSALEQQRNQQEQQQQQQQQISGIYESNKLSILLKLRRIGRKIKFALDKSIWQLGNWFCALKLNSIKSFLVAVDHCTSLHTICATTITIASVIHTVAHLINVINFSKNFDPLLSNLNMAEYKGQNPLQLLISVPGITGTLMVVILILMSLSSVDIIRNSSYDLFRIFHRLSIIFVILLFLHPISHVLKEQSNVDRHHPELCYSQITASVLNSTILQTIRPPTQLSVQTEPPLAHSNVNTDQPGNVIDTRRSRMNSNRAHNGTTVNTRNTTDQDLNNTRNESNINQAVATVLNASKTVTEHNLSTKSVKANVEPGNEQRLCLDSRPLFVAQSSICWYILCVGLSFYLLDLLLRKLRRSKSSIQLLDVRSDCEGNLIELVLSSNHKRFSHWLPGQFVYLNCPQIATYEWHPFTISSMDDRSKQFTLHIKTGGDWTRELRHKLECKHGGQMSVLNNRQQLSTSRLAELDSMSIFSSNIHLDTPTLPNLDCYNIKTGQLQIECTKLAPIGHPPNNYEQQGEDVRIGIESGDQHQLYTISSTGNVSSSSSSSSSSIGLNQNLNLFIDGPFHSPFERLLEQQVSVCIANGVGWTAFSSVFQCITNNFTHQQQQQQPDENKEWWTKWSNFVVNSQIDNVQQQQTTAHRIASKIKKLSDTKLHLMVIVTSIEQLKPFYRLALDYFNRIQAECQIGVDNQLNPVREITAFITRSNHEDSTVKDFCGKENLIVLQENQDIKVNEVFTIHFGKPKLDDYLNAFSTIYANRQKITVYCCGSYQVKKTMREICVNLNGTAKYNGPYFSYHEENF